VVLQHHGDVVAGLQPGGVQQLGDALDRSSISQ
jgi:hypothetical protein